jgi:ferric-dicitrate binding protein FerR (iron transport regulator)
MKKELLHRFFEGTAAPEEELAVKEWIDSSAGHRRALLEERAFFDTLLFADDEEMRRHKAHSKPPRSHTIIREILKIAAVAAILFLASYAFYSYKMDEIGQAVHTITVPAGQRANLQLPDGTNVWINARSSLSYPACFPGSAREVALNGEAYFEVACNARQPFIVHTKKYDINVSGTKFNVESYSDVHDFSTALMEGAVEIVDRDHPERSVSLSADRKAAEQAGHLVICPIKDYDIYRWRDGLICFKETDFITLMARFEKCYGIDIVIKNRQMANKVFSGKFRIADGIDNALRILQKEGRYTFSRNNEETIVYIN